MLLYRHLVYDILLHTEGQHNIKIFHITILHSIKNSPQLEMPSLGAELEKVFFTIRVLKKIFFHEDHVNCF